MYIDRYNIIFLFYDYYARTYIGTRGKDLYIIDSDTYLQLIIQILNITLCCVCYAVYI